MLAKMAKNIHTTPDYYKREAYIRETIKGKLNSQI